jgi:hypothetical protein
VHRLRLSLALLAFLAAAPTALHASAFLFTIATASGPGTDPATTFVASGTLDGPTDPANATAFYIDTITGNANGFAFLGIESPGLGSIGHPVTSKGFTFDNVLYTAPGVPHADSLGFLVDLSSPIGVSLAHVYSVPITAANPGGYEVDVVDPHDPGAITPFSIVTFTVTGSPTTGAVPEPSALALLGTGLVGLTGMVRRRFNR